MYSVQIIKNTSIPVEYASNIYMVELFCSQLLNEP